MKNNIFKIPGCILFAAITFFSLQPIKKAKAQIPPVVREQVPYPCNGIPGLKIACENSGGGCVPIDCHTQE